MNKKIKTRFAPSPTGKLHLGNARVALLNYLFSLKNNGTFLLRVDNTDTERSKREYIDGLQKDLQWIDIQHQEYFEQADRLDVYRDTVKQLQDKGLVYECYETPEELNLKRKIAISNKKPPVYDREMLHLTDAQRNKYIKEGRKPHLRFLINHEETAQWEDAIKGPIEVQGHVIGDPVIMRSDKSFLYLLPSIIDDNDYGITHVIRGEDHISNAATQIMMMKSLGHSVPIFAHVPLMGNIDGNKLSKRLNAVSIEDLRNSKYLPLALQNFLSSIGTSEKAIIFNNIEEIARDFDINRYSSSSNKLDIEKLNRINKELLRNLTIESVNKLYDIDLSLDLWNLLKDNIDGLEDIKLWIKVITDANHKYDIPDTTLANSILSNLPDTPCSKEDFSAFMKDLKTLHTEKSKSIFKNVRYIITGLENGPSLHDIVNIMGKDFIVNRIKIIINDQNT